MIGRIDEFTAGYFDVVITDECHRSIYGGWQAALTRFDAVHIGLTATPAGYIERNTYDFYQCEPGKPDFSYAIRDAFRDGFLVPYRFATGITEIVAEGAEIDDERYDPVAFERRWTNEESNRLMMREFDRIAWEQYRELAPGQEPGPGKAIVFAITKHHAARLARYLNELHPEHQGRYAEVITSDVADPDALIRRFKTETSPMVAVSVGMLDTGFNCREILHLVLCRRVRSPILYQQMRGRGTRTAPHIGKRKFVIYDFFRNHQYFNDSDEDVFTGSGGGRPPSDPPTPPFSPRASSWSWGSTTNGFRRSPTSRLVPRASASTRSSTSTTGRRRSGREWPTIRSFARSAMTSGWHRTRKTSLPAPQPARALLQRREPAPRLPRPRRHPDRLHPRRPRPAAHQEPRGEIRGDVQGLAGLPFAHSRPGRLSVPAQEPRHRHRARPPRRPLRAAPLDPRCRRQGDRAVR